MCGRFVQYSDPEVYASRFDLDELCEAIPRYNIAPTQPVLAIRANNIGHRQLVPLRWGLVPGWSKGPESRYSMFNARAETLRTKPAYRSAFKHRRCLIPTEGFYEWQQAGAGKQPYLIRRHDSQPFAMAGLWEAWSGAAGDESIESCTIIVTQANAAIRPIHDRMPVILGENHFDTWLSPTNADTENLANLLRPPPPDDWTLTPVSRQINNARTEGPDLIQQAKPDAALSLWNATKS